MRAKSQKALEQMGKWKMERIATIRYRQIIQVLVVGKLWDGDLTDGNSLTVSHCSRKSQEIAVPECYVGQQSRP